MKYEVARKQFTDAGELLKQQFSDVELAGEIGAVIISAKHKNVAGICGLDFYVPVMDKLVILFESIAQIRELMDKGCSVLVKWCSECGKAKLYKACCGKCEEVAVADDVMAQVCEMIEASKTWGGKINENGELIADLTSPTPGPHYYTNLLIGNRIGFEKPLQSTPKSVVDRLGRGSFRSHADTQVLATRWDYLPTENGFPANRQFYLVENGEVIFYSANPADKNVVDGQCIHSQNNTVITYKLACGLEIKRTIFILPQVAGLPLASEAQMIEITNNSDADRDIKLVYTGMFGTSSTDALKGDVIYTTVIMESNVLYNDDDDMIGVSYHYNPEWEQGNVRFHTMVLHDGDKNYYPDEYCFNYADFIGDGTLEYPTGAAHLNNRHNRKGPGFFAVGADMHIAKGKTVQADNITSLTSDVVNPDYKAVETFKQEAKATADYFADAAALPALLGKVKAFSKKYTSFLSIEDEDKNFETYVNKNLPFQVYYQTFVSRSFDQTQKGYREIGFREIQDIYASMYYWVGMGEKEAVKSFLCEWAANVFEFGFANHNYYWKGKEPGHCSDDQLWLVQALERYVSLTKDYEFLNTEVPMADGGSRKLIDTVKALIIYSSKISVGKHGLPVIDAADWNDCLHVDNDCIDGHTKQKLYEEQIKNGGKFGDRFESEYSESVMNGFLLKVAVDAAARFYKELGDSDNEAYMRNLSGELYDILQETCWKGDFFARVLFNRSELPNVKYLGAGGDGFSIEEGKPGAYYLNSFGWSILAGVATDEQIETMLDSADKYLKTPYGYRMCTGANYGLVSDRVAVALYFIGDRENGGIFKHANMMFAGALVKAANEVKDKKLAKRIADTVYWLISVIAPYVTMDSPFTTCGNPRFCTQYNNSDTGENIGPTLSGTSTWLLLTIMNMLGIHYKEGVISYLPIPKEEQQHQTIHLNIDNTKYNITVSKPEGFYRVTDCDYTFKIDGVEQADSTIPLFADGKEHNIEFIYN